MRHAVLKPFLALWNAFFRQRDALSVFLLVQSFFLLLGLIVIKAAGVAHAFQGSAAGVQFKTLFQVSASDFLTVSAVCAVSCLAWLPVRPGTVARTLILIALQLFFLSWLALSIINLEIYKSLGSPLCYNMLLLAPNTGPALLPSAIHEKAGALAVESLALICIVLISPLLVQIAARRNGWITRSVFSPVLSSAFLLGMGVFADLQRPSDARANALLSMNITSFFAAMRTPDSRSLPPPTGAELAALQKLCGEDWTEGKLAFEKFPRKKRNVIVFVWESVGAAFIKSHHPLGVAQTPELDALWRKGGVYCSECYAESPLSAQSGWSILTGMSPPARPVIFTYGEHMPPFTATLPAKLHEQGFATAMFGGSNFQTAAMDRIVDVCAFNVYEDLRNLSNRAKFGVGEFGVEDAALVDRTLTWIDGLPKGTPFFTLIWNSDTHYPYRYPGMPEALSNASPLERYYACVEHSDKEIGKLYRELQSRGLDKDTLLVVVGDHGEGMGRPPRPYDRGHSMLVYDDSIHVPLWFINPELPSSAAIGHLCRLADMFPTILSVSGASPAEHIDGHSLAETYPAQPLFARSIVWWPIAAKAGPFTLILSDPQSEPELYNTAADPSESHDLAKEDADTASVLMRAVLRFTVDRFKNDESFDFGFKFLPTGPATHPSRPTIDDLMKQK